MGKLCHNLDVDFVKQSMLDEVFRISKDNPGMISTILNKALSLEYQRDNGLNLALIMIDSRIEEIA